jgi:hypothetical protein
MMFKICTIPVSNGTSDSIEPHYALFITTSPRTYLKVCQIWDYIDRQLLRHYYIACSGQCKNASNQYRVVATSRSQIFATDKNKGEGYSYTIDAC